MRKEPLQNALSCYCQSVDLLAKNGIVNGLQDMPCKLKETIIGEVLE